MMLGYKIHGEGSEKVVVMHEWLGDHNNYTNLLPYLDQEAFTYIFVDLRGYGFSRKLDGKFTVHEATSDIISLIEKLFNEKVHLVGHSMSAMVAQRICVDRPDLIHSLVAVTPVPGCGLKLDDSDLKELRKSVTDDDIARALIDNRTGNRLSANWIDYKLKKAKDASVQAARLGYIEMFTETDFADEMHHVDLPLLVLTGEHDLPHFRRETLEGFFKKHFPFSRMVLCKNAGHYPMLEAPIFFASVIEKFFRENS
ncbi:MAG: alpha/beta hydrolase [Desulfobacterales bacterium]|nr:alpha/beta hydrolase [Desulfobacterales bacterium]MCP4162878.1 alpha/beta hydrolase [Deltaproteobacteria bacterium]